MTTRKASLFLLNGCSVGDLKSTQCNHRCLLFVLPFLKPVFELNLSHYNCKVNKTCNIILQNVTFSILILSPIRMRKKYTRVNILRCVNRLRCANQPVSKLKLRSHGFYHQEYFVCKFIFSGLRMFAANI